LFVKKSLLKRAYSWSCYLAAAPPPASPGSSKVTYAVNKMEQETTWEWG